MRFSILTTAVLILSVVHTDSFSNGKIHSRPVVKKRSIFKPFFGTGKQLLFPPSKDSSNGLECPKYEVKKKSEDYELRCYPSYEWAATEAEGSSYGHFAQKKEFMRLFRYIQGANQQKKKIDMTVPVAVKVEYGKGKSGTNRYTMLFFVPFEYQKSAPVPSDPSVSIKTFPKSCVYVRSYDGYSTTTKVKENLAELQKSLLRDEVQDYMDPKEVFYAAGYDAPRKIFNRRNEIWILQISK